MPYGITKLTFGQHPFLDISRDEYESTKVAKHNLVEVLNVEEKLDLILENYVEFERELLEGSLNNMVFSDRDWSSSIQEIHLTSRRLINLLTTCRLYADQVPQNISSIYGNDTSALAVKEEMSRQYDQSLGYRVLTALRNYVQHRSLPIRRVAHTLSREETGSGARIKHTVTPSLNVSRLKEDGKFKPSVLRELEVLGDWVDVKPLVREYIASIGCVHLFVRELLAEDVAAWENTVSQILERYRSASESEVLSVAVVERDDLERIIESVQIFGDIIERRQWLARKNQNLTHFNSQIITSEAQEAP